MATVTTPSVDVSSVDNTAYISVPLAYIELQNNITYFLHLSIAKYLSIAVYDTYFIILLFIIYQCYAYFYYFYFQSLFYF